jgi:hypothetical protein
MAARSQLLPDALEASVRLAGWLKKDVGESAKSITDLRLARHSNQSHGRVVEADRAEAW